MKRTFVIWFALLFVALISTAHEFWLQTRKYQFKVGEEMNVAFMVGENFQGEPWDLQRHKVEKLQIASGTMVKNLIKEVKDVKGKNLTYKFDREGTHLVTMESNFAFIELEAEKFNQYLEEDGIENILEERNRTGRKNDGAKEFYKRYAKLIVQCGGRIDGTFRRNAGFRYEITPVNHPAMLKPGDYLDCRLTWEGKPVPHTMVKVWSFVGNRIFLQNIYTENDGTIRFPISSSGPWMVSSVKMLPTGQEGADYESHWSSLVFEIKAP